MKMLLVKCETKDCHKKATHEMQFADDPKDWLKLCHWHAAIIFYDHYTLE